MSEVGPAASAVRAPQQARSRASWDRVLAVGRDLLESGGYEALTISEVCRRAGVTAPSIYARVDGRTGLFRAVYEDGMRDIAATEDELFAGADRTVASAVRAVATVFERHDPLLRAVIRQAVEDPWLLERGAVASRRLQARVVTILPTGDVDAAASAARAIYEACAFRTIYGSRFWSDEPEDFDAFTARLTRVAAAIIRMPEAL
jgi:AcrR family transcriptional regulator